MDKDNGYTLIELMIVVAIIAIVAAIAYPSYQNYKIRTHRTDVKAEILTIAQNIIIYKNNNGNYSNMTLNGIYGSSVTPKQGVPLYDLTLSTTAAVWTLTATPKSNTSQAGDGAVVLNSQGHKCWTKTITACTPSATTNWDGR